MALPMLLTMFLLLASPEAALVPPASAEVTVRASAARPAIERILKADNLEVEQLAPQEVAAAMEAIGRSAAPADFWEAYQAHVRAWRRYADLQASARRSSPLTLDAAPGLGAARLQINRTFAEVERVARRYGVRVPRPRVRP